MGENVLSGLLPGGSSCLLLFSERQYDEKWAKAELVVVDLIEGIQPSRHSEGKRRAVIEYVEHLIRKNFNYQQVFTLGSVPLKTYLPDGDIDFTTFSWFPHSSEAWANDLWHVLRREEHNKHAKFDVKEVQVIHAEVQIVKCLVDNIIVDISFNQLGGLCTLCFLEEVDRLIGKDHLFKRSIILVKAWCYYESRILGAHHGLLSTYALETLVLYIFNIFHTSLRGPFEVLHTFLQFFSQYDWNHYCLSLWGPIRLSALHEMIAEPSHMNGVELLFSHEFLIRCSQVYGVVWFGASDFQERDFVSKNMNIVDPLRVNNNLGRSVNRSNFLRICRAFAYGAKQIEKLLIGPLQDLPEKVDEVFRNTKQHCRGYRPDAPSAEMLVDLPDSVATSMLEDSDESGHYPNRPSVNDDGRQSLLCELLSEASETENRCSTISDNSSIDVASTPTFEGLSLMHNLTVECGVSLPNGGDARSSEDERVVAMSSRDEASVRWSTCNSNDIETSMDEASGRLSKLSSNSIDERLKQPNGVSASCEMALYRRGAFENGGDLVSSRNGSSNGLCTGAPGEGQQHATYFPAMPINHQLNDAMQDECKMESSPHARDVSTPGMLTGNFESFLFSLQACRLIVMSQFYSPIAFQAPMMYKQPFGVSGGSGRPPMDVDLNMFAQVFAYSYEQFLNSAYQRLSLHNAFTLPANSPYRGDTHKSHRGTGTYLPKLRSGVGNPLPVARDCQSNVRASKLSECNGFTKHDDGGTHTTRHAYGGKDLQERGGHKMHKDKVLKFVATSVNGVGTSVELAPQAPGLNLSMTGNSKHGEGSCLYTPSVTQASAMFQHPPCKPSAEGLQFGSFGSALQVGPRKVPVHAYTRKYPDGVRIDKLNHNDTFDSGEVTTRKVLFNEGSQHSLLKSPYELKEEDFPPLSTSGPP